MKFWQELGSVPKFHFGTPSDCQLKNEGCRLLLTFFLSVKKRPVAGQHLNFASCLSYAVTKTICKIVLL
ncbi:MAG: hypothetical protein GY795_25675, partial [Desulfobacterales bacterium]|nr:hypothetical protein [Desulfobacterales bacterium]